MTESLAQILDHIEERQSPLVARFAAMLEPMAPSRLEALAKESQAVTRRNFGRTMRLPGQPHPAGDAHGRAGSD